MARHTPIARSLGVSAYFCDSHSPWQRGSNENSNGLLRGYFPGGPNLSIHSSAHLHAVEDKLNNRLRIVLGGHSPLEMFAVLRLRSFLSALRRSLEPTAGWVSLPNGANERGAIDPAGQGRSVCPARTICPLLGQRIGRNWLRSLSSDGLIGFFLTSQYFRPRSGLWTMDRLTGPTPPTRVYPTTKQKDLHPPEPGAELAIWMLPQVGGGARHQRAVCIIPGSGCDLHLSYGPAAVAVGARGRARISAHTATRIA